MTREEKIMWLENAGAEEFLRHYKSTLARYNKDALEGENIEDMELAEAEMLKRLAK